MLDYLKRQADEYARLAKAYDGNADMQHYMREKVAAYRDAMEVVITSRPIAPSLDMLASIQDKTRPVYASEVRAILRTLPR